MKLSIKLTPPYQLLLIVIFSIFYSACSKDNESINSEQEILVSHKSMLVDGNYTPPYDGESLTVLGQKEKNPYLFSNMQKAFQELGLTERAKNLRPNCLYYKFSPRSLEEAYSILEMESENIYVEDYPLEYEVIKYGAFYMDSEATDTIIKPYYVLVYNNAQINTSLDHELLEKGYIPDENEAFFEELEFKAHEILGLTEVGEEMNKAGDKFFKPNGYVKVWDAAISNFTPVFDKSLVVRKGFKTAYVRTSSNGYFTSNKKFFKNAKVSIRWWNQEFRITGHSLSDFLGTATKANMGASYNIERTAKGAWSKSTINNAFHLFNKFASTNGIQTIDILHFWVPTTGKSLSGSTVMKKRLNINNAAASFAVGLVNDMGVRLWKNYSQGNSLPPYRAVHNLMFHELAHASHAIACGSSFWQNVVDAEQQNIVQTIFGAQDPYRDGTEPTPLLAGYIGMAEGWAEFLGDNISYHYYLRPLINVEVSFPQSIPSSCEVLGANGNYATNFSRCWVPTPLFHDLYDAGVELNQATVNGGVIKDDCTIPLSYLFSALTCSKNVAEFKNKLFIVWNPPIENIPTDDCNNKPCLCLFEAFGY